jgi:murein DD-endopeptidase MepM/ murein hydrolase activator NlpD
MIPGDQLLELIRRRYGGTPMTPLEELIPPDDPIWELIFAEAPAEPAMPGVFPSVPGFPAAPGASTQVGSTAGGLLAPVAPQNVTRVGPPPNVPYATSGGSRPLMDPKLRTAIPVGPDLLIALPPVPGGKLGNDWGYPRSGGRTHQGNDIFQAQGTPVFATMDGTVEYGDNALGGLTANVRDPETGTYTYNAHLSRFARRDGPVKAGEIIGYVGDTGNAQGGAPHLHFEYHPGGGSAVNPYALLIAAYEGARKQQQRRKIGLRAPQHKEQPSPRPQRR